MPAQNRSAAVQDRILPQGQYTSAERIMPQGQYTHAERILPQGRPDTEESVPRDTRIGIPPGMERRSGEEEARPPKRKGNGAYVAAAYLFVILFLSLIGYLVYFNVVKREEYLRSPYNKRQEALAERIERGRILSADGYILAETASGSDGEEMRTYPFGRIFAHVVGYDSHGRSGVESIMNTTLLTSHADLRSRIMNMMLDRKDAGDDVVTTLNARMQQAAYDALGDRRGAVVALDPKTGEMYVMLSKPDFDPNTIAADYADIISEEGSSVLVNRATQGRYVPGSTFKIVTALAYQRRFGITDAYSFDCEGAYTEAGHTVHCFNGAVHGVETLTDAFTNSCNCAFANIGLTAGAKELRETAESLLFNKALPSADLLYNNSSFTLDGTSGTALTMQTAFGQGNTLTSPYHMALIVSAIANGGVLMEPRIVRETRSFDGSLLSSASPKTYGELMTRREASLLMTLMRGVTNGGPVTAFEDAGYLTGGKTGSADFVRADGTLGTHAWFVGFAGKEEEPDIVIAVIVEEGYSGSRTAVPVAKSVFDCYYDR